MPDRVLVVELVDERSLIGRWRERGRRDHRVEYSLELVEPDDLPLVRLGSELHWSFARPGDDRLALVRAADTAA